MAKTEKTDEKKKDEKDSTTVKYQFNLNETDPFHARYNKVKAFVETRALGVEIRPAEFVKAMCLRGIEIMEEEMKKGK